MAAHIDVLPTILEACGIFCLDETGPTVFLEAGPKLEVFTTNKLDEMFWTSVADMDENLLLRGVDRLYCIVE
ncbi:MAG: hypothetical protein MUP21_13055 [Dehalococcoidia bacterium]|nr:hypothetical protein [Dehalococcoidia bacterium]